MSKLAAVDYSVFPDVMRGVGRVERHPPQMSQAGTSSGQANGQKSAADHRSSAAQEGDFSASSSASRRPKTLQSLANVLWMIRKDRDEARGAKASRKHLQVHRRDSLKEVRDPVHHSLERAL
ncbi:hypothetical protein MTO96_044417 [Rhipicephalus appendiculatus]